MTGQQNLSNIKKVAVETFFFSALITLYMVTLKISIKVREQEKICLAYFIQDKENKNKNKSITAMHDKQGKQLTISHISREHRVKGPVLDLLTIDAGQGAPDPLVRCQALAAATVGVANVTGGDRDGSSRHQMMLTAEKI